MIRVVEAGYTGAQPPTELIKAFLCQFYHCLPSELDDEPADEALQLFQMYNAYQKWLQKRPGQGGAPSSPRLKPPRRRR